MAAILFTACTQDEPTEQGTALPDGEYPLQIGSVNITAESSEQPWTRVSESTDGQSSVWQPDNAITVSLDGETATYTYDGSAWTSDAPLYWKNTQTAEVTAWYPAEDGIVNLSNQDKDGLTYVLHGTGTGNHQSPVTLKFTHQLAKVRVVLSGTQSGEVEKVEVHNYTSFTHTSGGNVVGNTEDWITMHQVNATTYEANVVPGAINLTDFIRLNGTAVVTNLTGLPATLEEGTMYTANITVGEPVLQDGTTLTEAGEYTMSGNYTQGVTIDATGKDITIKLDGVTLNTSGIGINVQSNATIQVSGADNTITSGSAGIYVAADATVTITGSGRDDQLTVRGGANAAGIGGYTISTNNTAACGNITIRDITVTSYGSCNRQDADMSPGIGSAGRAACGTITIDNATIHAYGANHNSFVATPAIGSGIPSAGGPESIPVVIISNSEVHAHRGAINSDTDYIGWGGGDNYLTGANKTINLNGGTCTSSTVYCYTGDTLDKTVTYDASGNATEQLQ